MDLYTFNSYEDYVNDQVALTRRKIRVPRKFFNSQNSVSAIKQYHVENRLGDVRWGACHGVRLGEELDCFQTEFGGNWFGTEITPDITDKADADKRIICWDFQHVKNEWIGALDMVYSNSLDHARDPWVALKAWLACLSSDGRLYVEWCPWHNKLGRFWKADCFAADDWEYYKLLSKVGKVVDVLSMLESSQGKRKINYTKLVFVVQ